MTKFKIVLVALLGLLLVSCTKEEEPTGDVTILAQNDFLDDANHIINSASLASFFDILEEQEEEFRFEEGSTVNRTEEKKDDSEKRAIFIFGNTASVRDQILSSFLNDISKDKVSQITIVQTYTHKSDYETYLTGLVEDTNPEETDSVQLYKDLLEEFGMEREPAINVEADAKFDYKQKFADAKELEDHDGNKIAPIDTDGYVGNASKLGVGFIAVFEENELKTSYLWNELVLKDVEELYTMNTETSKKEFKDLEDIKVELDKLKEELKTFVDSI